MLRRANYLTTLQSWCFGIMCLTSALQSLAAAAPRFSSAPAAQPTPGVIVGVGNNAGGQISVPAPNNDFVAIAAGGANLYDSSHALALKADGSIVAWGGVTGVPSPNTGFVSIAAGDHHSLGLRSDGSIAAWGDNSYGQLSVPSPNADFIAIAAGGFHSLGLKSNGSIVGWGANGRGQTSVPAPNASFVAVAAGPFHSLGLKSDGSIVAWGSNEYGQRVVPSPNTGFLSIAAGGRHNLALKSDGSIAAWGNNIAGQIDVPSPNTGFVAISAGYLHSMGLKADGSIQGWGDNEFGQRRFNTYDRGFLQIAAGNSYNLALHVEGCGDNVRQADEQCDGSDDVACPWRCQRNCTCGACLAPCDGPCLSLKGVGVNGAMLIPSNCISARPGDVITSEILISGWGAELPVGVGGYQARIEGRMGATSGENGTLLPLGWDAPLLALTSCIGGPPCPVEFPICHAQAGGGICVGQSHNPALGAFINQSRPDFILTGFANFGGINTTGLDYLYGMVANEIKGAADTGISRYAGTLKLLASGDACGVFVYRMRLADARGLAETFLEGVSDPYAYVANVQPLIVTVCQDDGMYCNGAESCDPVLGCLITPVNCDDRVACTVDSCNEAGHSCDHTPSDALCDDGDDCTLDTCTPNGCTHTYQCGSCCNHNNGACDDAVTAADCSCNGCEWTDAGSCASNECRTVLIPIPTTTHWGLIVLTLALLCIAKVYSTVGHPTKSRDRAMPL